MKEDRYIYYQEGNFKYQVVRNCTAFIGIIPINGAIKTPFIDLSDNGYMTLKAGFAYDGPSGPTIDTPSSMRGAGFHDGTYRLIRLGLLPESCRAQADENLRRMCLEDGMNEIRAEVWKEMVEHFAAAAAEPGTENPILVAPR